MDHALHTMLLQGINQFRFVHHITGHPLQLSRQALQGLGECLWSGVAVENNNAVSIG